RINIGKARLRVRAALGGRMPCLRIKFPNRFPGHAGTPQRVARQVWVRAIAENLAIDLQIRASAAFLPPQSLLAERSIFGIKVFFPQRGRLDDMAVAVENDEVLWRTHFPSLGLLVNRDSAANIARCTRAPIRRAALPPPQDAVRHGLPPRSATNRGARFR